MVFNDRENLAILELSEDRDYATYDELLQLLREHPSSTVYVEKDGELQGIITSGRIERMYDRKTRQVPFNKNFTYVHPWEYMRVRQIFQNRNSVNELPVVNENGRLLGDYVRWDSAICMDYAALLLKDPYVIQGLKAYACKTVLVQPNVQSRRKLFSWWKQQLEENDIPIQTIEHHQIADYLDTAQYFLFADKDELLGCLALYQYLDGRGGVSDCFQTAYDYLHYVRAAISTDTTKFILTSLQNQGVFVLTFDVQENENNYLAAFNEKIKSYRKQFESQTQTSRLPVEMKPAFAEELYNDEYKEQEFPLPIHFHMMSGIPCPDDVEAPFFHIKNGERLTVNQPDEYDRRIFVFGSCIVIGGYVPDEYTIPSLLQKKANYDKFPCKVINRGTYTSSPGIDISACLLTEPFKTGDILIIDLFGMPLEGFPHLNLTDILEENQVPASWFLDMIRHCNHKATQLFTNAIYQKLLPFLRQPVMECKTVEQSHDYVGKLYLNRYFSNFEPSEHGIIGSIVMNCNPFTFGHRYLIEEALKQVDFLIIFVVEEDASFFSFQERFAMVCQGTADLSNVMVVPSGPYILSKTTFPEYFVKETDENLKQNTEDDITLFAEKIAPRLGISCRFVGEERQDKVTDAYNTAMKRILPAYGIRIVEIPRKADSQGAISASRVRRYLESNDWDRLDQLVPASTKRILSLGAR